MSNIYEREPTIPRLPFEVMKKRLDQEGTNREFTREAIFYLETNPAQQVMLAELFNPIYRFRCNLPWFSKLPHEKLQSLHGPLLSVGEQRIEGKPLNIKSRYGIISEIGIDPRGKTHKFGNVYIFDETLSGMCYEYNQEIDPKKVRNPAYLTRLSFNPEDDSRYSQLDDRDLAKIMTISSELLQNYRKLT